MSHVVRLETSEGTNNAAVYVEPDGFRLSVGSGNTKTALHLTPDEARQLASIVETAADAVERMLGVKAPR